MTYKNWIGFTAGMCLTASVSVARAEDSQCAKLTYKGEHLVTDGKYDQAKSVLTEAIKVCKKAGERSARPYMALGKIFYERRNCGKAIPLFKEALKQEKKLARANMNLGACYYQQKKFKKAIAASELALKQTKSKKELGMIHHNAGLSYFNVAVAANNTRDKRGEPHFKKSAKYMPKFGANYFYLGMYAEFFHGNKKKAKTLFQKACALRERQGCDAIKARFR